MVYAKTPLVAPSLFDLMQSAVTLIWLLGLQLFRVPVDLRLLRNKSRVLDEA
jgi:hypothetical protein